MLLTAELLLFTMTGIIEEKKNMIYVLVSEFIKNMGLAVAFLFFKHIMYLNLLHVA